jgi:CubicO group peptidase (beta-lactamase class C family)
MYETGADVTGVLIARATGTSFGDALRERICEPLGMKDTAFHVPAEKLSRFATSYQRDEDGGLVVEDAPDGRWSRPAVFEEGGGGLVSTLNDYFAFASALLAGGVHRGERILSPTSVTLMTSDHLTPTQRALAWSPLHDDISWGFGVSVRTVRIDLGPSVGSYGWSGYSNVWYNDPVEDMTTILLSQRRDHPSRLPIRVDFLTAAYQAIVD